MFVKIFKSKNLAKLVGENPSLENLMRDLSLKPANSQKSAPAKVGKTTVMPRLNYQRPNPQRPETYWFKAKKVGYGWIPASREGWLVMILYLVVILWLLKPIIFGELEESLFAAWFVLKFLLATAIYKTGERPRWQWKIGKK